LYDEVGVDAGAGAGVLGVDDPAEILHISVQIFFILKVMRRRFAKKNLAD
jgi:hypothetical protein